MHAGTIQGTGTIEGCSTSGNRVTIESYCGAKRFHRQYREQWHSSTGTIGSLPLYVIAVRVSVRILARASG